MKGIYNKLNCFRPYKEERKNLRTLSQLELFVVVADKESFSKASEKVGMTPSTIMRQINSLEEEIGFELFSRSFQGLQMTAEGKRFYHDVKKVLKLYQDSVEAGKREKEDRDDIRIGIMGSYSMQLFLREWKYVNHYMPDAKISFVQYDGGINMPEDLTKEANINLVVEALDKRFAAEHGLKTLRTAEVRYLCGMNLNHRLANKNKISLGELKNERIIFVAKGYSESSDKLYQEWEKENILFPIEERNVCEFESFNECANSNKIIIFSETFKNEYPLIKKIPLETKIRIPFGITYASNHSKKVEKVLEMIRDCRYEINNMR